MSKKCLKTSQRSNVRTLNVENKGFMKHFLCYSFLSLLTMKECSSKTNNLLWPLSLNHLTYSNLFLQLLPLFHPFTLSLTSLALFIPSHCLSLPVHFLLPVKVHALPVPPAEGPQMHKLKNSWPSGHVGPLTKPTGLLVHTYTQTTNVQLTQSQPSQHLYRCRFRSNWDEPYTLFLYTPTLACWLEWSQAWSKAFRACSYGQHNAYHEMAIIVTAFSLFKKALYGINLLY